MNIQEIPDVKIEKSGSFKYVALDISNGPDRKRIVRGYDLDWHRDIVGQVEGELRGSGFGLDVCGGGRISVDHEAKTIVVGGRSGDYGEADHEATITLLKPLYPEYKFNTTTRYYF